MELFERKICVLTDVFAQTSSVLHFKRTDESRSNERYQNRTRESIRPASSITDKAESDHWKSLLEKGQSVMVF